MFSNEYPKKDIFTKIDFKNLSGRFIYQYDVFENNIIYTKILL